MMNNVIKYRTTLTCPCCGEREQHEGIFSAGAKKICSDCMQRSPEWRAIQQHPMVAIIQRLYNFEVRHALSALQQALFEHAESFYSEDGEASEGATDADALAELVEDFENLIKQLTTETHG